MVSCRAVILALLVAAPAVAQDAAFDAATGYRIGSYRGIVPGPPDGVARIDADTVARLVDRNAAILVDVAPAEGGVRDPATGRWRLARPAVSIPHARWFPEAGRGAPDPAIERGLIDGVRELVRRRPGQPVVVFCLADCWMSWNASRRLARAGVPDVRWFAEGSDGWRDLDRALVPVVP